MHRVCAWHATSESLFSNRPFLVHTTMRESEKYIHVIWDTQPKLEFGAQNKYTFPARLNFSVLASRLGQSHTLLEILQGDIISWVVDAIRKLTCSFRD